MSGAGGDVIDYESLPARRRLIWMRLAAWAICAAVLYFVIRALVRQLKAVDWSQVDLKVFPALAAIVCVFGVSAMSVERPLT